MFKRLTGNLSYFLLLFMVTLNLHGNPVEPTALAKTSDSVNWNKVDEVSVLSPSLYGYRAIENIKLIGSDARQQLIIEAFHQSGRPRDISRDVFLKLSPKGIVEIDDTGRLSPVSDGKTTLSVVSPDGKILKTLDIKVEKAGTTRPVNFVEEVVPIFTKLGCNGGGCHGKSGGQNGFRLSLLGFEPTEDFEWLVKESRSRRIIPAAPEYSLLLTKATGEVPHGGGKRLDKGSEDYELLLRWIRQGMNYSKQDDPVITGIEVFPKRRIMQRQKGQQLVVVANYSDGSTKDVTRSALYEANVDEMAKIDEDGFVKVGNQPGDVAVMIRFQGKVDVFRAMIPVGAPVSEFPKPSNFIDELVFSKLAEMGLPTSDLVDDNTFLRRVTLDIAGRMPTKEELNAFVESNSPDKRKACIERLLDSEDYAAFFANKWSALLRNKRSNPRNKRGNFAFHQWILDSFHKNKPYDQFVSEIITAQGEVQSNPPTAWYAQVDQTTEMLEDTAQLFLGTRIQCAQCHHHPFERWSQKDYYQFSAFFSRVKKKKGFIPGEDFLYHQPGNASAVNKKTGKKVFPAALGSPTVEIEPETDPRIYLAEWMKDPENPFFAQTLVNRYWKHFFGRGLVEPEDDIRATNPPTNPDLMNGLAEYFMSTGFDLKKLISAICNSKTYQLSSTPNNWNRKDQQHFSRSYPKRLPAEVLYDSIHDLTDAPSGFGGLPTNYRAVYLPDDSYNKSSYFLTVFGRPDSDSACECERTADASLAQSLHLINSKELQNKLSLEDGFAAQLAKRAGSKDPQNVSAIYQKAFSREPSTNESQVALLYLEKKSQLSEEEIKLEDEERKTVLLKKRREAFEDIIWALINTKEFLFNH